MGILGIPTEKKKLKLLVFYKMVNSLSPTYLSSLVPSTVGNITTYQLCNANSLHTIRANSQLYYYSLLPSLIRDWNELPDYCSTHLAKWHLNVILTITLLTNSFFSLLINAWDRSTTHEWEQNAVFYVYIYILKLFKTTHCAPAEPLRTQIISLWNVTVLAIKDKKWWTQWLVSIHQPLMFSFMKAKNWMNYRIDECL